MSTSYFSFQFSDLSYRNKFTFLFFYFFLNKDPFQMALKTYKYFLLTKGLHIVVAVSSLVFHLKRFNCLAAWFPSIIKRNHNLSVCE